MHAISDKVKPSGKGYSAELWHEYFKQRYLGAKEERLPNGKTITVSRSTTSLDKEEMTDYLNKIIVWAAERGIYQEEQLWPTYTQQ